jgi:hypothetical protein
MTHLTYCSSGLEEAPDLRQRDDDGRRSHPGLLLWEHRLSSPPPAIMGSKAEQALEAEEEEGDPWLRVR